jgi:transcriptional regulator with XRE-family HTH domain
LAKASSVSKTTIARVELGLYVPFASTLRKLAAALGVEPSALIDPGEMLEHRRGKETAA